MTFSESGHDVSIQASNDLPQLEHELFEITNQRTALRETVENQWPEIPSQLVHYLAENCSKPELMSFAMAELKTVLALDPKAFSDPELIPVIVEDCISMAAQSVSDEHVKNESETTSEKISTRNLLSKINAETSNLKGHAKLAAARDYLNLSLIHI